MNNASVHFFGLLAAIAFCLPAAAVDLQPGEIRAPQAGVDAMTLTWQFSERGTRHVNGQAQAGDPRIVTSQLQARFGHGFEFAERPAYAFVQVPAGYVHPQAALSAQPGDAGLGDATVLLAWWPHADRAAQRYLAVAGYLTLPTGSYSAQRNFNMGGNRYSGSLQTGFQLPLADRVHWMTAVDGTWFGRNADYRATHDVLEQKPLYVAQSAVQYFLDEHYSVAAGYFHTVGGETSVNGLRRNDTTRSQRYQLSGIANFGFGRFTLQYGGDLRTENGYIENRRWTLRLTRRL